MCFVCGLDAMCDDVLNLCFSDGVGVVWVVDFMGLRIRYVWNEGLMERGRERGCSLFLSLA